MLLVLDSGAAVLGGNLVVRMVDSGAEMHIRTGDFFDIPPGHDGYVDGPDRVPVHPAVRRRPRRLSRWRTAARWPTRANNVRLPSPRR